MLERDLIREAKKLVHQLGGVAYKMHGNVFTEAGIPDLLIIMPPHGKMIACEMKVPGKKPTPIQELQLQRLKNVGAHAFFCDNLEDFKKEINQIMSFMQ